jgi:hypothetical protein
VAGEIAMNADVDEACAGQDGGDGLRLCRADLDNQSTAWSESCEGRHGDGTIGGEAIRPGKQRRCRLVGGFRIT